MNIIIILHLTRWNYYTNASGIFWSDLMCNFRPINLSFLSPPPSPNRSQDHCIILNWISIQFRVYWRMVIDTLEHIVAFIETLISWFCTIWNLFFFFIFDIITFWLSMCMGSFFLLSAIYFVIKSSHH